MLWTALQSYQEIADQKVCDLGSGTSVLSIAAALCGAEWVSLYTTYFSSCFAVADGTCSSRRAICSYVLGIELDEAALATAKENLVEAEVDQVDIIRADVAALNFDSPLLENLKRANFDTVISE